jgi:hypothetical protein
LLNLLIAVDELNIQILTPCIKEYLINNQYEYLRENPIEILEITYQIHQHDIFSDLWNSFLKTICETPGILFNSDKLIKLRKPLLELLLKRDDLLLDEFEIWNNLIKWSLGQHPSIQQDVEKWNNEEITIMKNTIDTFIPLIRFYHISLEDFHLEIYPFKILLPEDLINNILKFHTEPNKKINNDIQPPRNPKYDTNIIKPQHFAIFSSWIEKRNDFYYKVREIPYYFKLIYRASRDGNTTKAFHDKCDNKGATIVVAKLMDSEQIMGGYSPLQWESNNKKYKYSKDSFIFSFTNRENLQTAKVGHINDKYSRYSIFCHKHNGPTFGCGHDLFHFEGIIWKSYNISAYPKIDLPTDVTDYSYNVIYVEDYEVFQVIKI